MAALAAIAAGMISAQPQPSLDELAARLTRTAEAIAASHAQDAALAQASDPARWRQAELIWPQFTTPTHQKG